MKIIRILLAMAVCWLSLSVAAQWQWVDKEGRRVFSDRPPPLDVPERNILKQPSARAKSEAPAPSGTSTPQAPQEAAGTSSGVDKELVERKKRADEAEAAKNRATDERVSRMLAENCLRARQAKASLDAGQRISRTNEQGEREFLDDAGRVEEARRLQAIMDSDCR